MSKIIDIHGQHDNQNLLDNSKHIIYLDEFIGSELYELKEQYMHLFVKYKDIIKKLECNYGDDKERQRKLDLLEYQFNEIKLAKLKIGEDEELQEKHNMMKNSEKLQENLNSIDENLNYQVIDGISDSIKCLEKIEDCGEIYSEKLAEMKNIYYEIQELSRDICDIQENTFFDEYERDSVEKRLDEIFSLKRKYGNHIEEILQYKDNLEQEIYNIKNMEEINLTLKEEQHKIELQMHKLCDKMEGLRKTYAINLENEVNKELKELEMYQAEFFVKVSCVEKV